MASDIQVLVQDRHQNIVQLEIVHVYSRREHFTGANSGADTVYPSRAPEFIPGFKWGSWSMLVANWLLAKKV
jgi:hypothetical protein